MNDKTDSSSNLVVDARLAVELREEAELHHSGGKLYRMLRAAADAIERLQHSPVETKEQHPCPGHLWTDRPICIHCLEQMPEEDSPEEPKEHPARSLAEEVNTLGRQHPSKVHDAGSNPVGQATPSDQPYFDYHEVHGAKETSDRRRQGIVDRSNEI